MADTAQVLGEDSAVLYTVGHGTRTTDELVAILLTRGVVRCVDVRRYPGSRRHPHFAREALERSLPEFGVTYEWRGDTLGGRRKALPIKQSRHPAWQVEAFRAYAEYMDTPPFREALCDLLAGAATMPTAVMCAETLWWRCHRRLIADAALIRGVAVLHLGVPAEPKPHPLHPAARRGEDGWPAYDVEAPLRES